MIQKPATAALCALLIILPGCFIGSGNRAAARDVERPVSDPPQPESKYYSAEFDARGLSEVLYQTPPDRAFVLREVHSTVAVDILAEVGGNLLPVAGAWMMRNGGNAGGALDWTLQLPTGAKMPAGAALRVRRGKGQDSKEASAEIFIAGDLVRVE